VTDVSALWVCMCSSQVLEPAMSSLLDLLGGSGTKSLKEAASRALDTSVAYVPARY